MGPSFRSSVRRTSRAFLGCLLVVGLGAGAVTLAACADSDEATPSNDVPDGGKRAKDAAGDDDDDAPSGDDDDDDDDGGQTGADGGTDASHDATTDAPVGSGAIQQLSAGSDSTCALDTAGKIWCWGGNAARKSAEDPAAAVTTPTASPRITNAVEISARSGQTTCARQADGKVTCWGTTYWPSSTAFDVGALEMGIGLNHACIRNAAGSAVCWGSNFNGQLGDGTTKANNTPSNAILVKDAVEVIAGSSHSCARRSTGTVQCWGANGKGQLGDGTTTGRTSAVTVSALADAKQLTGGPAYTCALKTSGQVSCWGQNFFYQLGDGSSEQRTTPALVSGITDAMQVSAGVMDPSAHTCARHVGGTVSCWGRNDRGQLGDGTKENRKTPVQVKGLTDAVEISAGGFHTCARRATGAVVCWGANDQGQLGDGTKTDRLEPVAVAGLP